MLSVFRKCRYKVLATGTLTRNNVVEAAPQLELLYAYRNGLIKEKDIIQMFFGINTQEMTLEEIGDKFGL